MPSYQAVLRSVLVFLVGLSTVGASSSVRSSEGPPAWLSLKNDPSAGSLRFTAASECNGDLKIYNEEEGGLDWTRLRQDISSDCLVWIKENASIPQLIVSEHQGFDLSPGAKLVMRLTGAHGETLEKTASLSLADKWRASDSQEWMEIPEVLFLVKIDFPRVEVQGLPPGYHDIELRVGDLTYEVPRFLVRRGQVNLDLGEVLTARTGELCGKIADWRPALNDLEVFWEETGNRQTANSTGIDSEGLFCLPDVPGTRIWLWAESDEWHAPPIEVEVGDQPVLQVLPREGIRFSWSPVGSEEVRVRLFRDLKIGGHRFLEKVAEESVVQEEEVKHNSSDSLLVLATPDDSTLAPMIGRASGDDHIHFDFHSGATLVGIVADKEGSPVADVPVKAFLLLDEGSGRLKMGVARTDREGGFVLERLPAGEHLLEASAVGFKRKSWLVDLEVGEEREFKIELERGARVSGIVVDRVANEPVSQAVVSLIGDANHQYVTELSGKFAFDGLNPGEYIIKVEAPGMRQEDQGIEVREGDPLLLRIPLSKGTRWLGAVELGDKQGAEITLIKGAEKYTAPIAADGSFVVENGPAGNVGYYMHDGRGNVVCTGQIEVATDLPFANVELGC